MYGHFSVICLIMQHKLLRAVPAKYNAIINSKFKAVMKFKITVSENACIHLKNKAIFAKIKP
ncbi:MAG: hypothetical protein A2X82_06125 [Geobacteraceae bacterium GWC2_55_20]|nr:MAG: hypothetical protein A2X82_06125 [Geobacteraceae bacterium GWC2_55_20]OGU23973.1 MAG: hypothetical protein A2X85_00185 [Geobacteraceae bacterium GWF2_54_21]HCE68458.1 hypothetical protein [Geobacter sp.]